MTQGEAIERRITARSGPVRSGHVAGDLCELRRGGAHDGVGNATSPVLGYGKEMDIEEEDVEVELWADWLGRRRGGTAGRARRSAAELAEDDSGRNVEHWRAEWRV